MRSMRWLREGDRSRSSSLARLKSKARYSNTPSSDTSCREKRSIRTCGKGVLGHKGITTREKKNIIA
ncbi:hypothetical protein E2C01_051687 [Portunus trituberculatus]|uniref:Uncharacterized protein n=1 Tax=Portunus trituberculatus TaxID=210409 RepID=A0A5B7GBP3_PORTR|nr:hypothetical protein [Portunus trituberculatus]